MNGKISFKMKKLLLVSSLFLIVAACVLSCNQKPGPKTKKEDLNASDIDAAVKIIAGTARSMGIEVV